jgi:hypothetical protein
MLGFLFAIGTSPFSYSQFPTFTASCPPGAGISLFSSGLAVGGATPLKGEAGALSPWQKRNFLPLPQGQG